jgi:hypothetical protein
MSIKYLHYLGLLSCVALVISCFVPLTYHADVQKYFTAFFSEKDQYGKPGLFITIFVAIIFVGMLVPKIWAKRVNLFLSAITFAYVLKTYILFSSCYNAYCPQKQAGLYVMFFSSILLLISCMLPNVKLSDVQKKRSN